jgi:hypothetical protein
VVLEFLKSNQGSKRVITMKHNGQALPPQLAGRFTPQAWAAFMQEVYYLADHHPYVIKPSAGRVAGWAGSFLMGRCGSCSSNSSTLQHPLASGSCCGARAVTEHQLAVAPIA